LLQPVKSGFAEAPGDSPQPLRTHRQYAAAGAAQLRAPEQLVGARRRPKLEYFNPAGSVKDRIAWAIIREAEAAGALKPGDLIVDVTSGNTGIGLAAVAASRGYRAKFYVSDNISPDKTKLLRLFGAEVDR
jgi:cysteine synthase